MVSSKKKNNLHSVATIYRFLTPFSDLEKEEKLLEEVLKKIISYLKSESIRLSLERKNSERDILITFELAEFGKFIFFFRKIAVSNLDIIDYALPIFEFDILFDSYFISKNKERLVDFLTNIFECFDGVNERGYLIELDKSICYRKFFVKKCPHYDFQEVDELRKQFERQNGIEILKNFLEKYHGKGFVLNSRTANIYLTVHGKLLYLFYLLYSLYIILYKTEKLTKNLKVLDSKLVEYKANLTLFRKRLEMLGDATEDVFKKYLIFLKKFLSLFER